MSDDVATRFATVSDEHVEQLLDRRLSTNTRRVIENGVATFSEYARARNTSLDELQLLSPSELDTHLGHFYSEVRRKDGSLYTRNGLISVRYGLQHHFRKTCGYDIVNDATFRLSNEVFFAVLVDLKNRGKGGVQHKQQISSADLSKLYTSDVLSVFTPAGLQNKVFVDLMVHLCNPGRVYLRDMKKSDFHVRRDAAGRRYVLLTNRKLRKKHRANESGSDGRMYHMPGNPQCPVASFEKYVAKLNRGSDDFWQKPSTKPAMLDDLWWYENSPIGKNMLATKMKMLSVEAQLSAVYTNHCLRMVSASDLESLAGRKPEISFGRLSRNVPDSTQPILGDILVIAEWQPANT